MFDPIPWSRAYADALTSRDLPMLAAVVINHPASHLLAERIRSKLASIAFGQPFTGRDRLAIELIAEIVHDMEAKA